MALQGALSNLTPKAVFVTGANRGVGLNIVKQLLNLPTPPCHVFATCRDPSKAQDLQALKSGKTNVHIIKLEVTDYEALPAIVTQVENTVGADGLNLLINNAGILEGDKLDTVTPESMRKHYEVNCIAPIMISRALAPVMKKAAKGPLNASTACIANISTKVGSVADNSSGNIYAYRSSKAGLNIVTKSLSVNLKDDHIMALVLHPGWVQTDMGGSKATTTVDDCASGLLKVLAAMNETHNGTFYDFKGIEIPW